MNQFVFKASEADERIRTADPLFTKQPLCQLSYVGPADQLYGRVRPAQAISTFACSGSSGLIVIWLTGTVSLTKVVTKVPRAGSHQVTR